MNWLLTIDYDNIDLVNFWESEYVNVSMYFSHFQRTPIFNLVDSWDSYEFFFQTRMSSINFFSFEKMSVASNSWSANNTSSWISFVSLCLCALSPLFLIKLETLFQQHYSSLFEIMPCGGWWPQPRMLLPRTLHLSVSRLSVTII